MGMVEFLVAVALAGNVELATSSESDESSSESVSGCLGASTPIPTRLSDDGLSAKHARSGFISPSFMHARIIVRVGGRMPLAAIWYLLYRFLL